MYIFHIKSVHSVDNTTAGALTDLQSLFVSSLYSLSGILEKKHVSLLLTVGAHTSFLAKAKYLGL